MTKKIKTTLAENIFLELNLVSQLTMSTLQEAPMTDQKTTPTPKTSPNPELVRIFNSALVSTRAASKKDAATEILQLVHTPAFEAIMDSIRNLSMRRGISESEAAEWLIQTFRKIDECWSDHLMAEGLRAIQKS